MQSGVHLPLTLALPASAVMQASPPDVPATLVGVGEGVAVGVGDASIALAGVAVGVGVAVAVATPAPDTSSSRAILVPIAAICRLRSGISATCLSSVASLSITSLDAAEVAVGVGVATGVTGGRGADVAVGVGVAVARGADVAVGVGVAAVVSPQNGNPIKSSQPTKSARRDWGIQPVN